MASVNKVILVGNLGRDPELRTFPSGGQVTNISIATTEQWKDRQSGERRELTEWHNVVFSDRLAEIAGQYLRKGSSVYVEGRIRTRKWQDQNGQDRYTTEIRADVLKLLGSKDGGQQVQQRQGQAAAPAPAQQGGGGGFEGDDIPFAPFCARASHLAFG